MHSIQVLPTSSRGSSTSHSFSLLQAQDIETLKKFLLNKKPHVVTIAGENRSEHAPGPLAAVPSPPLQWPPVAPAAEQRGSANIVPEAGEEVGPRL